MKTVEYERMYHAETHHWWYMGMAAITRGLLDNLVNPGASRQILDAGCGTGGAMSTYLAEFGNVTGIDVSQLALRFCQARRLTRLAHASVTEIPFKSDGFNIVTSFDVIYERLVDADSVAIAEFFRVLQPGGILLLRVPAYDWLRGEHDTTVQTARRYTRNQVTGLLKNGGFRDVHTTYANTFLFPLAAAKRMLERIWPPAPDASDLSVGAGGLGGLLGWILGAEAPLVTRVGLPFGLSVIAWGKKPVVHA